MDNVSFENYKVISPIIFGLLTLFVILSSIFDIADDKNNEKEWAIAILIISIVAGLLYFGLFYPALSESSISVVLRAIILLVVIAANIILFFIDNTKEGGNKPLEYVALIVAIITLPYMLYVLYKSKISN